MQWPCQQFASASWNPPRACPVATWRFALPQDRMMASMLCVQPPLHVRPTHQPPLHAAVTRPQFSELLHNLSFNTCELAPMSVWMDMERPFTHYYICTASGVYLGCRRPPPPTPRMLCCVRSCQLTGHWTAHPLASPKVQGSFSTRVC